MDTAKDQIIDRLNQATNILVTVSANPSVDQLSGAIGMTLLLNKLGKHSTAVFSGNVPSTIEFLQPEKTLEKNTDSLRDFIIALDKSKADKLRYKVEDQMVKIFITPYRATITDKDLEFSQGDFNVEVVLALGVDEQTDLDQAITAHGRILHDATVIGVNTHEGASLGSINWARTDVCGLSEMLVDLGLTLKPDVLDGQMATAFLTGIVSETARFSNEKTSSQTMQLSAKLMAAGANQQLVASQLQPVVPKEPDTPKKSVTTEVPVDLSAKSLAKSDEDVELPEVATSEEPAKESPDDKDGALRIEHDENQANVSDQTPENQDTEAASEDGEGKVEQIHIDEAGSLRSLSEFQASQAPLTDTSLASDSDIRNGQATSRLVLDPPTLGGKLTANSEPEALDPSTDPLGAGTTSPPLLSHDAFAADMSTPKPAIEDIIGSVSSSDEPVSAPQPEKSPETLSDLEKAVASPHLDQTPEIIETPKNSETPTAASVADVNEARDAVMQAVAGSRPQVLEPVQALNAQPMDLNLGDIPAVSTSHESDFEDPNPVPLAPPLPEEAPDTNAPVDGAVPPVDNPYAPPSVPPPMMPPNFDTLPSENKS